MLLSNLPEKTLAIIKNVQDKNDLDIIAQRLRDLGFIKGELIQVITRCIWKSGPIIVQVGLTCFAMRKNEADRVNVIKKES